MAVPSGDGGGGSAAGASCGVTCHNVVVISGYVNPIHAGHVEYARLAYELANGGTVVFIVNNDAQVLLKRGSLFVPELDRLAVVAALRWVHCAVLSTDADRTVCSTLRRLCIEGVRCHDGVYRTPTHFANGGDVTAKTACPEAAVCAEHGVALVYGLGPKVQSSSWILSKQGRTSTAPSSLPLSTA